MPATLRFADAVETREDDWQAVVIRHLGLDEWIRREFTDELDLVGPVAGELMDAHGLPYPYNLHLLAPLIQAAHGGSFVTGLGGDQVLTPAGRVLDLLARRTRATPRDAARIAAAVGPRAVRRIAMRRQVEVSVPWLRPEANARLEGEWLEHHVDQSFRWDQRLRDLWRSRFMQMTIRRFASFGEPADVEVHHPFVDGGFVFSLAQQAGATGFESRTAAMHQLFDDALPPDLVSRPTKATFNEVLWNRHSRSFVDALTSETLERALAALALSSLVEPRALAAHWGGRSPSANSFLLLQACWLALRH